MKDLIKINDAVFGSWCIIPSPEVINIIAKSTIDFIIIDLEHGATSFSDAQRMVMAAHAEKCKAILRVASNNESEILKALDIGSDGIIVPHISNSIDRAHALNAMNYHPLGNRGYSPYTRAGGYRFTKNFTLEENQRIFKGIIIEDDEAINNLDEILNDNRLDLVYIGAYDISISMGCPGEISSLPVQEKIRYCIDKIHAQGKIAGCMVHNKNEVEYYKNMGVKFLVYKVDTQIIFETYESFLKDVKCK